MVNAVAVYLILRRLDGDILIMRRFNTGYMDGMYHPCSGHVEMRELPTEAMIREAKEEIGIVLKREDLALIHISARPKHDETGNRIDMFYLATRWRGRPKIMESDKCDDMRWSSPDNLPENFVPHMAHCIALSRNGILCSEFDLTWIKSHTVYEIK